MTDASTREQPWPVAVLGAKLQGYIDRLGAVWVEGELTGWGISGGNVYGKLKDLHVDATISFKIWSSVRARIPADLAQGQRVVALVKAGWWVKGGSLDFQVLDMRHVGVGDLLERLEQLRAKLRSEGLFDSARKRPLPFLPHRIGLITGKDSDAEKDVLRNAQLRWPQVDFRIEYANVQGDQCVPTVLAALRRLEADPDVDVIVIARGGGDFQNLLGFSDEKLLRAVAAASTPIVSAIGHENDRPLLDDVADLRASTPTDAAKRIVPDVAEQLSAVRQARGRLATRLSQILAHAESTLSQLRSRPALADPSSMITTRSHELTRVVARGREVIDRRVERDQEQIVRLQQALRALSPQSTLDRGYAIAHLDGGAIIRDAGQAPAGAGLRVTVARGTLAARSEGEQTE